MKTYSYWFKKVNWYNIIEVVKNDVYEELIKRFNAIDASKLVDKTDYNSKIKYIEDKQPSITNVATAAALSAVESDVSNVIDVVKKGRLSCKNKRNWR